jgi:hypothetical protein
MATDVSFLCYSCNETGVVDNRKEMCSLTVTFGSAAAQGQLSPIDLHPRAQS